MYCIACGTELTEGARFCHSCGVKAPIVTSPLAKHETSEWPAKPLATTFVSGHSLAQWVIVFFAAFIVWGLLVSSTLAFSGAEIETLIVLYLLVLFLPLAVLFTAWIYRVYRNLSAFGVSGLKYSPGWAAGCFFVPILNLWRPYMVVEEIWKASDPNVDVSVASSWQNLPAPPLITLWWSLFIAPWFIRIGLRILNQYGADKGGGEILLFLIELLSVGAAVLAIFVVRQIDKRQEEKSRLLV